ncbi:nucleotidyltransferase family protein [Kitasatospora viridis]|uniref:Nucleotidyltransferase-like protein n=1 Tax=Kitasatospora viridis TaxID=281105 RepID=A0A561SE68_9ACTN|nr:nucleotidyltransferase family protein [Kitasatospora viridis]TWF73164.1 nucleotidyltransferase-like protein [Kitasatospora viridis]
MKAVVMAGGVGSRLRPITDDIPKPLVPIDGTPVMGHVLELMRHHGVTDAVVTVRYRADQIIDHFGDGDGVGVKLTYLREREQPLGTAGAVYAARHLLDTDEPFLVISSDALTDIDLTRLARFHATHPGIATLCLTEVEDPTGLGVVELAPDGEIRRFVEKPAPGTAPSNTANTGIYLMDPRILRWITPHGACDWATDVFPRLMTARQPLYGCTPGGYWRDIGTHQQLAMARGDAVRGTWRPPVR